MHKEVIIIGAGGHSKVVADIIEKNGDKICGFLDDNTDNKEVFGYPVLGKVEDCDKFLDKEFFIAIGNNTVRKKIATENAELKFYTAIHPSAIISKGVEIGIGTCVMAGAIINADAKIGKHAIINSGATIEHDNTLADFVHVSPGAVLCGTVKVGESTHVGAGVAVKNNISITSDTVIGVGAAVVKDIEVSGTYCGVPAKKM